MLVVKSAQRGPALLSDNLPRDSKPSNTAQRKAGAESPSVDEPAQAVLPTSKRFRIDVRAEDYPSLDTQGMMDLCSVFERITRAELAKKRPWFQEEDIQDILQDALVKFSTYYDPERGTKPTTFFKTCLSSVISDQGKRDGSRNHRARMLSLEGLAGDEDIHIEFESARPTDDPSIEAQGNEILALRERALHSLPEAQRQVLRLREDLEMSYSEIADALGVNEGTIKSRINRARQALREAMQSAA